MEFDIGFDFSGRGVDLLRFLICPHRCAELLRLVKQIIHSLAYLYTYQDIWHYSLDFRPDFFDFCSCQHNPLRAEKHVLAQLAS